MSGQDGVAVEALGQDDAAFLLPSLAANLDGLERLDGDGVDAFVAQSFGETLKKALA